MTGIGGAAGAHLENVEVLGRRLAQSLQQRGEQIGVWTSGAVALCWTDRQSPPRTKPSAGVDGTSRLVFSGHLYNEHQIKDGLQDAGYRLPPDPTAGDLALAVFETWGNAGLASLDGSFALAIHNEQNRETILISDRFSSRPLFWSLTPDGTFAFGTQAHAVQRVPGVSRDLDRRGVQELLHYQRLPTTRTLTKAISLLPPGTVLRARDREIRFEPWFDMVYRPEQRPENEWAEIMAETFRRSVRASMGDAPQVGLLLSGGLDSRMVVAAAERNIHCFHFNDSQNEEYATARAIAATRSFPFTYLQRPKDHYATLLEDGVRLGDGMFSYVHAHPFGLIPEDTVDVMLHGHVPELYFRGPNLPRIHRTLFGKALGSVFDPSLTPEAVPKEVVKRLAYGQHALRPSQYFTKEWAADYESQMLATADELVSEARPHSADHYDWFLWADTRYHCRYPSFLFQLAVRSSAAERSVVFHNDVLDLHLRMPVAMRSNSRVWNQAVRTLAPDIAAVPNANTGYSPFLSRRSEFVRNAARKAWRIASRRQPAPRPYGLTAGSWPNFGELIIHNAGVRNLVTDVLHDRDALDPSIFDLERVHSALSEHLSGMASHEMPLLLLTTFGHWHRTYGPGQR